MPGDLNHLPVNWIDGMKISRKHFEQTGLYTEARIRDMVALQLTDYNFGILPSPQSLEMTISVDSNLLIQIELNSCKAITPDGSVILVLPEDSLKIKTNYKDILSKSGLALSPAQQLYVILSTDIFRRLPAGEPLMEENPPRHPYTKPEIGINIFPAELLDPGKLMNGLLIGKIIYQNGELIVQKDFVPSCTSMNSLSVLTGWFTKFRQALETWEQYCLKIVQKINSKVQSQQPNVLANSIRKLSEKMLEQLVRQKTYIQWIGSKSAPIHLCASLLENIQYIHTVLQCYAEKDREEMLNYFAEWTDAQAGTLENQTLSVLQLSYSHYEISTVLNEIYQSYLTYIQIFQKLSQLEFIGKKKGQGIFVIEQEVKETKAPAANPVQKPGGRWSPLT